MRKLSLILVAFLLVILGIAANLFFFGRAKPNPQVSQENNYSNNMKLTSPVFRHNGAFPKKFTCNGEGANPALDISDVPDHAKSLVLVLRDPDAVEGIFIHWLMWNIDPGTEHIEVDSVPKGAIQGLNTEGKNEYTAPCPPNGTHRYIFTLYALDTRLNLPSTSTVEDLNIAMDGRVIDKTDLLGLYR